MMMDWRHRSSVAHRAVRASLPRHTFGWLLAAVLQHSIPAHADYRLGPQDKLRVKVSEWRPATGQVYEWTALGGEFIVSATGTISLPLVGEIPAANRLPNELATAISEQVQSRIGLAQRPSTAVDVITYRPIYVVGGVDKPGEYSYRPGMTILKAVAISGGFFRLNDAQQLTREVIGSQGELTVLITTRFAELAHRARLEAELQGGDTISFPTELMSRRDDPAIVQIMRDEELQFAARRESLQSQVASLKQTKDLLQKEITSLEAKGVTVRRQLGLSRQELDNVNKLVDQKLAVSSRRLSSEQTVSQLESASIDLDLAALRARQDISKVDRDTAELTNRRRNELLVELTTVRDKLSTMAEKRLTLERLSYDSLTGQSFGSERAGRRQTQVRYSIDRSGENGVRTLEAMEEDEVLPGDLIKVEVEMPPQLKATGPTQGLSRGPAAQQAYVPEP